ncbi:MAG: chorismate-binding protein, partial [candidate division Zixibacteria bacterium]|nr:chorismate-binding protein [candidate division Zixibacteria bacterium]
RVEKLDAAELFMYLWRRKPASFYSFFHSGPYRVISTSPERFLQVRDGQVLSQPIKGTLRFEHFDDALARKLTTSTKEDSELSMIVDLIRNDISYNCRYGSVRVENHKSTFVVDNLLQMYSNVTGILKPDRTCVDLLLDAFPGGSVTGCPKRMSMQLIDQLEPHTRDIYCGSLFVLRDRLNMDSSVAIRTGFLDTDSGELNIYGGSGIVIDSDPEAEYLETLAKAEKFIQLAPHAGG